LREVIVQVGFTRFESAVPDVNGELDLAVERAALSLNQQWLPAVENRGEGIFIGFAGAQLDAWKDRPAVTARGERLVAGYKAWLKDHPGVKTPYPGLPYVMLHTLSHLLITAVALDCGYAASSIRERIHLRGRHPHGAIEIDVDGWLVAPPYGPGGPELWTPGTVTPTCAAVGFSGATAMMPRTGINGT
jgi:hypothetical protein